VIVPLQVTFFSPPGRFAGTKKLRAEKKVLPLRVGFDGTVVVEFPLGSNVVVAKFTAGSKITVPFGTLNVPPPTPGIVMV